MTENVAVNSTARTKSALWFFVGLALLLLLVANGHLVYVAMTSQPECVTHIRQGEAFAQGQYSAAQSSCTPR
jgi:hypothetical protein